MIVIDVTRNIELSPALPLRRVAAYTGSALFVGIKGVPADFAGAPVVAVSITLVNADGISMTAPCTKLGNLWTALFAPSFVAAYGFVSRGVKVDVSVQDDSATRAVTVGVGDFEILADAASVRRGDPDKTVQGKGDDVYIKSEIVGGVQRYKRLVIARNERIGWGFELSEGDFVLVDGEFQEAL